MADSYSARHIAIAGHNIASHGLMFEPPYFHFYLGPGRFWHTCISSAGAR